MNTIRKSTTQDLSQRDSSTNPDFIQRVANAMMEQELQEELTKQAKLKAGKPLGELYRGHSDTDTNITQRITKATFQAENDSDYRQQLAINEFLKEQAKQLKEDAARNAQYAKELKRQLSTAI